MSVKWYEFETALETRVKVANPSFAACNRDLLISNYQVKQSEFNRVLAEWEADQHATKPAPVESQWKPKVGDWVRVKDVPLQTHCDGYVFDSVMADSVGRVFQVEAVSNGKCVLIGHSRGWYFKFLEPATLQPIDKLGWWLVDGRPEAVISVDGQSYMHDWDGVQCEVLSNTGIFLAEITGEELVAYHRNRIVPKCPVEVQS